VFDRYDGGHTISGVFEEFAEDSGAWPEMQPTVEAAVLDLLEGDYDSDLVEKGAELVKEVA
jgi:hypothetical protein